ncbi:MAG: DUF1295 domain-containing protein [Panacibacter sp.]
MEQIAGFFAPLLIYTLILILAIALPGRWVTGYVTKAHSSQRLRYRLNGILVFFIVVATWFVLGYKNILPWDWLYVHRWQSLLGAVIFGLLFSLAIVLPNEPVKQYHFADLYLGRLENPQLWNGRLDAKMCLYLIGAVMLELNALSFCAHHYLLYGMQGSTSIIVCTGLLSFFLIDYLSFEEVHLYTYDFFAERVGFKLGWGCIAFYPFFYAIPLWATVDLPGSDASPAWLIFSAIVFFGGWALSRGANLQKYHFKKDPNKVFLGITLKTIADNNHTLLVNGFWGLSRHINYLGEILMATGLVLSTGYAQLIWPWLYPLYYVALLFPRQADDDKRCALKYGALWNAYKKKVPYRIIPFIY